MRSAYSGLSAASFGHLVTHGDPRVHGEVPLGCADLAEEPAPLVRVGNDFRVEVLGVPVDQHGPDIEDNGGDGGVVHWEAISLRGWAGCDGCTTGPTGGPPATGSLGRFGPPSVVLRECRDAAKYRCVRASRIRSMRHSNPAAHRSAHLVHMTLSICITTPSWLPHAGRIANGMLTCVRSSDERAPARSSEMGTA